MLPQHHPGQVPETKWQNNPDLAKGQTAGAGQYCQKCSAWLGTLGLEPTPDLYVEHLVLIFREVKRVLADDGTLWLNIGDSRGHGTSARRQLGDALLGAGTAAASAIPRDGFTAKQLIGIPWMVAFALRADGWYLRSDIIWHKPNVKPESVRDRPTSSHEYVFLLSKSARYFYDVEAIKEPSAESSVKRVRQANFANQTGGPKDYGTTGTNSNRSARKSLENFAKNPEFRQKRDVWSINTEQYSGAHFATFPPKLVEPCILAGTSEKGKCPTCGRQWRRIIKKPDMSQRPTKSIDAKLEGVGGLHINDGWKQTCSCPHHDPIPCVVLDPFSGSGTTLAVAAQHGRFGIGIELNPGYIKLAMDRIAEATRPVELQTAIQSETEVKQICLF
jgi:DNA modification methylase